MSLRVLQWATGSVGTYALRAILEHPELELAGVLVHSADKEGRDAGELCGLAPVGIAATRDPDELLATEADCVSHCARNTRETADEMARILSAGYNLVSTALLPAFFPQTRFTSSRSTELLEDAARTAGVSCFISGIDPGFATDALPIFLTAIAGRVDSIRISEIFSYAEYDDADTQFRFFGFGQPMDSPAPPYLAPGRLIRYWGPTVEMVAAGLGVELEDVREVWERAPAPHRLDVVAGSIEGGTVGGIRFEVQGIHAGRPLVILEHVTRLHADVAPEWSQPAHRDGSYRIRIEGWPSYELDLHGADPEGSGFAPLEAATALRIVNAIPRVVASPPGLLSPFDLGLVGTPGLVR